MTPAPVEHLCWRSKGYAAFKENMMYSNDYVAFKIIQDKYKDFRAEAIKDELAWEAGGRREKWLVRAWHSLQAFATKLKRNRQPSENTQGWHISAEVSLRK